MRGLLRIKSKKAFILSNSSRRFEVNDKSFARISQGVYDHYQGDAIFIESNLNSPHASLSNGTAFINEILFLPVQFILVQWYKMTKPTFDGKGILEKIEEEETTSINLEFRFYKFLARYHTFKLLLKIHKPEVVFVECYYDYTGYIAACTEMSVPVIELQHGLVNEKHRSYNYSVPFSKELLPDFLFTFGFRESKILNGSAGNFIDTKSIRPIGFYLFDLYANGKVNTLELPQKRGNPTYTISIAGQDLLEEKLIPFINLLAKKYPTINFYYIPRNKEKFYIDQFSEDNVCVVSKMDVYQAIHLTQLHVTVFSTTAIEALAMGTPVMLLNIDNLSKTYLKDLLGKPGVSLINAPGDFTLDLVEELTKIPRSSIMSGIEEYYRPNYLKNLSDTLLDLNIK
jgi:hypothetical protein